MDRHLKSNPEPVFSWSGSRSRSSGSTSAIEHGSYTRIRIKSFSSHVPFWIYFSQPPPPPKKKTRLALSYPTAASLYNTFRNCRWSDTVPKIESGICLFVVIYIRNTDSSRDLKSETQIRAVIYSISEALVLTVIYIRNTDTSCHLYQKHLSQLLSVSDTLISAVIYTRNTDPSCHLKSETQIPAVIYIRNTDPSCHLYPKHGYRYELSSISKILIQADTYIRILISAVIISETLIKKSVYLFQWCWRCQPSCWDSQSLVPNYER